MSRLVRVWAAAVPPLAVVLALLAAWEAASIVSRFPTYVLPRPSQIARELLHPGSLFWTHTWITLQETLIGFVIGSLVGLTLAIAIVLSPLIRRSIYPLIVLFQTVPKIVLAPIFIIWFGYGLLPKEMLVVVLAFFPVTVDAIHGLTSMDPTLVDLLHSVSASRWEILWKIQLPHSTPHIFSGLKVASTLSVIGAIVGEWAGANGGLGFLILSSSAQLETVRMFSGVVAVSIIGLLLFYAVSRLEDWLLPWREKVEVRHTLG